MDVTRCKFYNTSIMMMNTFIFLVVNVFDFIDDCIVRPQDKSIIENYFSSFSINTYVVGTKKNRFNEMVLLSAQKLV